MPSVPPQSWFAASTTAAFAQALTSGRAQPCETELYIGEIEKGNDTSQRVSKISKETRASGASRQIRVEARIQP